MQQWTKHVDEYDQIGFITEVPSLSFFQATYWLYVPMSLESIETQSRKIKSWYAAHSPIVYIHQLGLFPQIMGVKSRGFETMGN